MFQNIIHQILSMPIEQMAIAVTGVTAIFLSQSSNPKVTRFACLFGLAGQPFWLYTTYISEQGGMFVLCCFYTWAWAKGFNNHWLKNRKTQKKNKSSSDAGQLIALLVLTSACIWLYTEVQPFS